MAYVIINGRGLSGALHGGPAPAVRGGMQRGMRDGRGPTFPLTQDGMFREPAVYTPSNNLHPDPLSGTAVRVLSNGNVGLSGPLKLTIEHLGGGKTVRPGHEHVRAGLKGLGDSGQISDGEARQRLDNLFATTCQSWIETINQALDDMPVFPVIAMQQARSNLRARRDQITSTVLPQGIAVIEDTSLSVDEVTRRVGAFLQGFLDVIKLDIQNAQQDAKHSSMLGQLQTLLTAMQTVVVATAKFVGQTIGAGANAAVAGLPDWFLPLVFIAGGAYILHELRG